MFRRLAVFSTLLLLAGCALSQNPPASDPQALAYAAQSIATMTEGTAINDVTLTGTAAWNGVNNGNGSATLRALGTGESRLDIALSNGTRTEVRDAQTGYPMGQWFNPGNTSGYVAYQNCWTDAVWFFPALGSLAAAQNLVLSYIGQETRNGESVQHIRSYVYQANPSPGFTQQMSTMDFYLDAATLLPVATLFSAYPDDGTVSTISVEIDFSNYQSLSGVRVPLHIQRYSQGNLLTDITISEATFNTGLPLSLFTIN